ncbi:beta-lactamase/transpeptidase-like protein [Eremomyces bilateralis CBS 781.70]|uniref:Beta-lactamase/transpeptidase-like protein n=1 Tax=Eremomyces bilateralis CBS 781.70 TaxID=1392243 RepID=A0A6G1FR96_9PEZI|nr:beta-lactamase/transpeptidase-like protein [Eremomyces bilateralis CBS 781.70]KAF1808256.1 beta-lactamase/transpeptidase-like protein [Eremomyces bilateralis CBS 781.70]
MSLAAGLQGFTQAGLAGFNSVLHQMVDNGKLANVVSLVSHHGQIVNRDAYGVLDISAVPTVPAQTDSIFRIASMTKPITGAAMMILWEEGKWKLDDPVAKHIPEFKDLQVMTTGTPSTVAQGTPMTMDQLMSHTAGFGRSGEYTNANITLRDGDLQAMIDVLAQHPLYYQPGKEWRYGPSVDIQGYLVEKLSHQSLDVFFRERLFTPLRMPDTGFWVPPADAARVSRIHTYDANRTLIPAGARNTVVTSKPTFLAGGGGLMSTVTDYWRFAQMILNGGELDGVRILQPETVKLMHTDVLEPGVEVTLYSPDTKGLGFGLDFAILEDPGLAKTNQGVGSFYWGGAFGTWFWIDPVNELIVIGFIQNLDGTTPDGAPDVREASAKAIYAALEGNKTTSRL